MTGSPKFKKIWGYKLKPKTVLISVVLLLIISAPLVSDWQFTRWGMSETELIVAAPNVQVNPGGLLGSNLKVGNLRFMAQYTFRVEGSTTRLFEVRLKPKQESDCGEIIQLLGQKYGPSYTTKGVSGYTGAVIVTWRDEISGNKVEFIRTTTCEIVYSPLDTDSRDGL